MSNTAGGTRRPSRPKPKSSDTERRRFAEAIARAELGRFYWSDRQEQALREAMKRLRKPSR